MTIGSAAYAVEDSDLVIDGKPWEESFGELLGRPKQPIQFIFEDIQDVLSRYCELTVVSEGRHIKLAVCCVQLEIFGFT